MWPLLLMSPTSPSSWTEGRGPARSMQDMGLGDGRGLATSQTPPSFPGFNPGMRDFPRLAQESGSGAEARRRAQTPDILSRWPEMISKPHKSWSRGGGSTTIPTRCGLDSGASEINIIWEAFSSKSFLLPSLPRGPEARGNGAEEAAGEGKERKCIFLEGLQPRSRPRAILHAACSLSSHQLRRWHYPVLQMRKRPRERESSPEVPAESEANPALPDSEASAFPGRAQPHLHSGLSWEKGALRGCACGHIQDGG